MIEVRGLEKVYRMDGVEIPALGGISLTIQEGEFVAIMGASGSGKSTFMNILGFLDLPTKGVYLLEGVDGTKLSRDQMAEIRNQKIGFVFQGFNLLARTSALHNVELPLIYAGVPASRRKRLSYEALAQVNLEDRAYHNPSQLSGGQQQRVAIARALVNRPSIILADEPTGNLDSRTSVEIMAIFQRLNRDSGITVIMITHEPSIAAFAQRRIVFRDGVVVDDEINPSPDNALKELEGT